MNQRPQPCAEAVPQPGQEWEPGQQPLRDADALPQVAGVEPVGQRLPPAPVIVDNFLQVHNVVAIPQYVVAEPPPLGLRIRGDVARANRLTQAASRGPAAVGDSALPADQRMIEPAGPREQLPPGNAPD